MRHTAPRTAADWRAERRLRRAFAESSAGTLCNTWALWCDDGRVPEVDHGDGCHSDGMDFFESIPQPPSPEPPRRPRRRPWMQPETVIPGSVPAELLLVRHAGRRHHSRSAVALAARQPLPAATVRRLPPGVFFPVPRDPRGVSDAA